MAVVGHVEWVEFARVSRVPLPGEIVHAGETWEEPGGSGAVAAVQLVKLAGNCSLFTALGGDDLGRRSESVLKGHGVALQRVFRRRPQRRAFTFIDASGERTITTIGERMRPLRRDPLDWEDLANCDAVYVTAADPGAVRAARAARVLVATSRVLPLLAQAGVLLDAVVGSGSDRDEGYQEGLLDPPPALVVMTGGERGGEFRTAEGRSGTFPAQPPPGPVSDAYGSGDSFAAGLTYGLGAGYGLEDALALAARCGAACLTGRGPYRGQLVLAGR